MELVLEDQERISVRGAGINLVALMISTEDLSGQYIVVMVS